MPVTIGTDGITSSTGSLTVEGTGALRVSVGTTGEQPGSPETGMIRFNSDTGQFEGYNGTAWAALGGEADLSSQLMLMGA
jgi:hypothetical protein